MKIDTTLIQRIAEQEGMDSRLIEKLVRVACMYTIETSDSGNLADKIMFVAASQQAGIYADKYTIDIGEPYAKRMWVYGKIYMYVHIHADWMKTVYERGIAVVDSFPVLQAEGDDIVIAVRPMRGWTVAAKRARIIRDAEGVARLTWLQKRRKRTEITIGVKQ